MDQKRTFHFDSKLLHHIRHGWVDMEEATINEDMCHASDTWGTLLHYAAFYGNDAIIGQLIELGSSVDSLGHSGRTPLMMAIMKDHAEAVKTLLDAGADIDLVDSDGKSALKMIFDSGYFEPRILEAFADKVKSEASSTESLVDRLTEAGCSLYHVASFKDVDMMKLMLRRGFNVNSAGYCGKTALHAAVELNDLKLASMLIENGADVNTLDNDGTGVLYTAASKGREDMVQLLLERGADPNLEDLATGCTPFFAIYVNSTAEKEEQFDECAELLLQHGAVLQNSLADAHTLLDHALFRRSINKVKLLIGHLALLELNGEKRLDPKIMQCNAEEHIRLHPQFEEYYAFCQQVLKMKILGASTIVDLLNESESNMRLHVRNSRLVRNMFNIFMELHLSEECPYYFNILWTRVSTAIKIVKLEDRVIPMVCDMFRRNRNACYGFARQVVSYLSESDLETLSRV